MSLLYYLLTVEDIYFHVYLHKGKSTQLPQYISELLGPGKKVLCTQVSKLLELLSLKNAASYSFLPSRGKYRPHHSLNVFQKSGPVERVVLWVESWGIALERCGKRHVELV